MVSRVLRAERNRVHVDGEFADLAPTAIGIRKRAKSNVWIQVAQGGGMNGVEGEGAQL